MLPTTPTHFPKRSIRKGGNRPTRASVNIRTHELALLAGRIAPYVTQRDYEQAKREITGETDRDLQNELLDTRNADDELDSKASKIPPLPS